MGYPCRFISPNVFDLATLTSSLTPLTNTSLNNLKSPRRSRTLRWLSVGSGSPSGIMSIKGTWNGEGKICAGIALDRFNFYMASTVRFRGYTAIDWTGAAIIDTGTVAAYSALANGSWSWGVDPLGGSVFSGFLGYKFFVKWFSSKQTIGSFILDIYDENNSNGYSELSRVVLGDSLQATYSAKFGLINSWEDSSDQVMMDGGSTVSDARIPRRIVRGELTGLTAAERTSMYALLRYVGKTRTFLVSFQSGEGSDMERDFTIPQAKFVEVPGLGWMETGVHSMPFVLVEG